MTEQGKFDSIIAEHKKSIVPVLSLILKDYKSNLVDPSTLEEFRKYLKVNNINQFFPNRISEN